MEGAQERERLAVRRPWLVIGLWLVAFGALAGVGVGVEERLHRTTLSVPGTGADRAERLAAERFGPGETLSVLLLGPRAALDAQGPEVAERLGRERGVSVLSPWTGAEGRTLRPRPDQALLVLRAHDDYDHVSAELVPRLRAALADEVRPPVRSHLTGYADIGAGIERETLTALTRAELIAAPLLLLILLAVFRSPVAAGLPLLLGLATIAAGRGLISLVNSWVVDLDAVALNLGSMIGLALGVDYSLLMLSRFREELAGGAGARAAARTTAATAGRTVVFAGLALGVAALGAYFVSPGNVLASGSAGILAAVVLSVVAAGTVLPAILALMGERVNKWTFGGARRREGWAALAWRSVRRPALATALILGLLLALSVPALALNGGPPDPRSLPADSPERRDFEQLGRSLGGGWSAPYEIIVATDRGTIADPRHMRVLERWQRDLSADPNVAAVLGPAQVRRRAEPLREAPRLLARAGRSGRRAKERLGRAVQRLDRGVERVRVGLGEAAAGASRLAAGAQGAAAGAAPVSAGAGRAAAAAEQVRRGLERVRAGARALAAGARRGERGARRLRAELAAVRARTAGGVPRVGELAGGLREGAGRLEALREPARLAQRELAAALEALESMSPLSQRDPQYARAYEHVGRAYGAVSGRHPLTGEPVRPGYAGLDASLADARDGVQRAAGGAEEIVRRLRRLHRGLGELAAGAAALQRGAARLRSGLDRLGSGTGRLAGGTRELDAGLDRLAAGGGRLAAGVGRLREGAGRLAAGLHGGHESSSRLAAGTDELAAGTARFEVPDAGGTRRLADVLRSGYATVAALDSAGEPERTAAGYAINVDRGGSAARIVVIERGNPVRDDDPLRARLERDASRLAATTGLQAAVGGPATVLQDFDTATSSRLPLLILTLAVVTYLVLVPVLRSLLLPLIAVLLNVLTVGAAFGVLVLAFQGAAPLGGPGFIDAIMVMGIYSVVFGLSIDYEVFLLARMREGWVRTGRTDAAISFGLVHTAAVITGAALIMTAVFVAFAASEMANLRQYGIGLTVAVILDATVVRLVLLPAVIRLVGDRVWWLPGWLDRRLPDVHVEGRPSPG